MNAKVREQLRTRKQRIARRLERIDRRAAERPELAATNIRYEIELGRSSETKTLVAWPP